MAATIKDIAKRTGLGLATISSYLNGGNVREKNRIAIEQAIEELHFEVNEIARSLKTNRSKTIGIVIPEFGNLFFADLVSEMEDIFREKGYACIVCDCRTNPDLEKEAVRFLLRKRVDGIINLPVTRDGRHLQPVLEQKKPVVLMDRKADGLDTNAVLVNNAEAVEQAVDFLMERGHRKIGVLCGPQNIYTARERLAGYKKGMEKWNVPLEQSLILQSDYTISGGAVSMQSLVEANPRMTAVIATNYELTMGGVIAMNEMNLSIPKDLSFIGFDNREFAQAVHPRLTIVVQPTKEMATYTARRMLELLSGKNLDPEVKSFPVSMISGKSVRAIGGK